MGERERESVFVYTIPLFSLSGGGGRKGEEKTLARSLPVRKVCSSVRRVVALSPSLPPLKPTSVARRKDLGRALKGGRGEEERWRGWEGNVRDAKKCLLPPPPLPLTSSFRFVRSPACETHASPPPFSRSISSESDPHLRSGGAEKEGAGLEQV